MSNQSSFSLPKKIAATTSALIAARYLKKRQHDNINKELTKNRKIMIGGLPIAFYAVKSIFRRMTQQKVADSITTLTTDEYSHNLIELLSAIKRASLENIILINIRATQGTVINKPLGSSKQFDGFDNLMFVKPQLGKISKPGNCNVDMEVTLGPKAQKPLVTKIPLLITGMAYGVALSEQAKIALAKGARTIGTATNSGEGPSLAEERKNAGRYILQIARFPWGLRTNQEIESADMLEVQVSQGAQSGTFYLTPEEIKGKARKLMGLSRNQGITSLPAPLGVESVKDWRLLVDNLRKRAQKIPIGVKMMATHKLEEDLEIAIDAGFDVIAIDGAQGGSFISNATMQDDLGIPSLHALVRAVRYLQHRGIRNQISLIVAGGYYTPGSCLKALALGADAIYLGTVPLYALVNKQHKKVLPLEPPTTLVSYSSKYKNKLDIDLGAERVANVLRSMVVEMEQVLRALGKSSIKDLNPDDLVALDSISAEITGVQRVY
ncbi:MAG: glutamate synthase [Gracilibacter sp. BRH_c7a]|nr:MAG: glutamate synthase [Gracilibacter sp. BRH_c7a]